MVQAVRYAVIGLGDIAQTAILPAFAHAKRNSRVVALFSDDPTKLRAVGRRYDVEHTGDYDRLDEGFKSARVDAAFIAVPNNLHGEIAVRVASAGVHVLCEKPLAPTVRECDQISAAAADAGVQLMTGYRLHFDPANLAAVALARSKRLGDLRVFTSSFSMQVRAGNTRTKAELAGGPLLDLGIYCVNAARYLFAAEPTEVIAASARSDDPRFAEIPEMVSAILRFPGERLAQFTCSFGSVDTSWYELVGTRGRLRLDRAFNRSENARLSLQLPRSQRTRPFPKVDQFAAELLHFSDCILEDRVPIPSGLEGTIDVAILEAIDESARSGRSVRLRLPTPERRPDPARALRKPPVRAPARLHAAPPRAD